MVRHCTCSIEFKRLVAHDYVVGETPHSPARRHDLPRTLIPIWVQKYEAGARVRRRLT
jgi:transposase